jgi:sulfite reductase alpha subunit-like flavoprotein
MARLAKNNVAEVNEILQLLKIQAHREVMLPFLERKLPIFSALFECLCRTYLSDKFWEWVSERKLGWKAGSYIRDKMLGPDQEGQVLTKSYSLAEILKKFRRHHEIIPDKLVSQLRRLMSRLYSV